MKKLYFLPYKMGSGSVSELQKVLGGLKIKPNGNYVYKQNHLVVNWGHGAPPYWAGTVPMADNTVLNKWSAVSKAINKHTAFDVWAKAGVPVPEYTTNLLEARKWVEQGAPVFCRKVLDGMEGRGIVVARKVEELVQAPLYTKLFSKDKEYRVHVFKDKVLDFVQKKLRNNYKDIPNRSEYIRNTANGWIFARTDVALSNEVKEIAVRAVSALSLDFGAVDLAVNRHGQVVVFEVNTAPGLEGTTIQKYAEAIKELVK